MVAVFLWQHNYFGIPLSCKKRFCVKCCKRRAKRYQQLINAIFLEHDLYSPRNKHRLKFISLTVANFPTERLGWGLDKFFRWFRRLRQRNFFKKAVRGFFYAFEITKGNDGLWHLHLHILADATYMDNYKLSDEWRQVVSPEWRGFITYIEEVKNIKESVKEVSKYPFKPGSLTLAERCFLDGFFRKRRLVGFGGEWYSSFKGVPYDSLVEHSQLVQDVKKKGIFLYTMKSSEFDDSWFWSSKEHLWIRPEMATQKRE